MTDNPRVPEGVLRGIEDIEDGNTADIENLKEMLKAPDDGNCPRCGAELENVQVKIINNDGWLAENAPPAEPDDDVSYKTEESCTDCSYQYG